MLQHCCAELVADVWPHPFTPSNILQRNYFNGVANLEQHIFCIACVWLRLNRLSNTGECYHQWRFFYLYFQAVDLEERRLGTVSFPVSLLWLLQSKSISVSMTTCLLFFFLWACAYRKSKIHVRFTWSSSSMCLLAELVSLCGACLIEMRTWWARAQGTHSWPSTRYFIYQSLVYLWAELILVPSAAVFGMSQTFFVCNCFGDT